MKVAVHTAPARTDAYLSATQIGFLFEVISMDNKEIDPEIYINRNQLLCFLDNLRRTNDHKLIVNRRVSVDWLMKVIGDIKRFEGKKGE